MKHHLLISVIIPVYNRCQFLFQALDSVVRQRYEDLEIFIVDDGSTEAVEKYIESYPWRIRYLRQDHRGPAAARNAALRHAQGDLIAFLDNDDLWTSSHLTELSRCLQANPAVQIAQGQTRNFRDGGRGARFWCSSPYHMVSLQSAVFRRELFETIGVLDESMQYGEDLDFFIRCWEQNIRKVKLDHLSLLYRRHGDNMTANKNLRELGLVGVYRKRRDRVEQGLCKPRPDPFGLMRDYLGPGCTAYDDGSSEPVDQALFGGPVLGREHESSYFGDYSRP